MFRDSWGLIVTQSGDGGDSLRYESCFWLGHHLRGKLQLSQPYSRLSPEQVISLVEVKPGVVVRHPNALEWWSDPKNTSRDQTLGAFILGQVFDYPFLRRLIQTHSKRWWMCSNGSDSLWLSSVVPRARGGAYNILLYITDWFFLFDFFVAIGWLPVYDDGKKKLKWYDPDDTGKFWNLSLAMCQPGWETWIRRLMRWVFANFCRQNNGTVMTAQRTTLSGAIVETTLREPHPIAAALKWEARTDTPELADMWIPLIYRYFPRSFRL